MKLKMIVAMLGLSASFASLAVPLVLNPTTPPMMGTSGEPTLQSIVDGLFLPGHVNVATAPRQPGLFTSATPGLTSTIPTIVAEYTANAATQSFGIFFGNDTDNILSFNLLPGSATVGGAVGVTIFGNTLDIIGGSCLVVGGCLHTDARINSSSFGFYFQPSPDAPIYYSLDQLNTGTRPDRVVAFQDGATTNWLFAYEDGTDFDYNDMAVKVESINAVPEPETYALMLAGLGAMGFIARRRKSR